MENPIIGIKNIEFAYTGNQNVLNIPQLNFQKNEKVFIYGPSGSGKSTLLNLLTGILIPQKGDISILDQNLSHMSAGKRDQWRGNHLGYIFQNFNLIPYLSVKENILLSTMTSKAKKAKVAGSVDEKITKLAKHLKIDSFLNQNVQALSIGQQQRVAVARALLGSPEIVIADEPTSSLDEEVTDRFMQLIIDEYNSNPFTLIFVSHDKRLAKFFDREISLPEINQVKSLQEDV
jgi:putative ABC transport system ATP-binding protein